MSETVAISRHEWRILQRQIVDLKSLLEENELINDRVNDKEAMQILNVSPGAFKTNPS